MRSSIDPARSDIEQTPFSGLARGVRLGRRKDAPLFSTRLEIEVIAYFTECLTEGDSFAWLGLIVVAYLLPRISEITLGDSSVKLREKADQATIGREKNGCPADSR